MNFSVIFDNLDVFIDGTINTIKIASLTLVLSVALAFVLAILRDAGPKPVRAAIATYSWVMRAIPTLTILFFAYYGLPSFGISFDAFTAVIVGSTISAAGYNMEYIRAGLRAVPTTQYEAARALGIPYLTAMRRLILPQAMRTIIPPLTNNLTLVLKGSSLANLVTMDELTGEAMALISITYRPIEILIVVAVIYLMLNGALSIVQMLVERHFDYKAEKVPKRLIA